MADIEIIKGADNGNPPDTLREMYPKINRNFQRVNSELTGHVTSTTAHKAENITYSGIVPGSNVKVAVDNLNTRISEIVAQSGDDITELVDARGSYSVLRDRLDASDIQMNERIKKGDLVANVLDFGAVGDGTTDDTVAFQNAIDHCINTGRALLIPANTKSYLIGDLIIDKPITVRGIGRGRPVIKSRPNTVNLFTLKSRDVSIETLRIDMNLTTTSSSSAFYFDTTTTTFYNVQIRDIEVWNAYNAIRDANSTGVIVNTYVEDFTCVYCKGTQIIVNDSQGFVFFVRVIVDLTTNTDPVAFPAWKLSNTAGLILQDCDALGHGTGDVYNELAVGFELNNCTAVWFNRVMVDYMGGTGVKITGSNYIYLNDLVAGGGLGEAIIVTNSTNISGSNVLAIGSKGKYYEVADKRGVIFQGVEGVNIASLVIRESTSDGLYFKDCSRLQIGSLQSTDNAGYGIKEEQTAVGYSVANIINSSITARNASGNANLVSSYTYLSAIVLNSGSAQFQKSGPLSI